MHSVPNVRDFCHRSPTWEKLLLRIFVLCGFACQVRCFYQTTFCKAQFFYIGSWNFLCIIFCWVVFLLLWFLLLNTLVLNPNILGPTFLKMFVRYDMYKVLLRRRWEGGGETKVSLKIKFVVLFFMAGLLFLKFLFTVCCYSRCFFGLLFGVKDSGFLL